MILVAAPSKAGVRRSTELNVDRRRASDKEFRRKSPSRFVRVRLHVIPRFTSANLMKRHEAQSAAKILARPIKGRQDVLP
jgi:hypothetical protein